MKSMFRFILGLSVLLMVAAGQAVGQEPVSSDMARILKRGKLVVAVVKEDEYPFFMRTPHGEVTGFDIDMARDIAARLGVRVEFDRTAVTYDEVIDRVARKEADLGISDLTATPERAKRVSFTMPYLKLNTYILANRRQMTAYRRLSTRQIVNRPGVEVLAKRGTSYIQFAKTEFPLAAVLPHGEVEQAIQEVLKGRAFGLFEGEAYVKTLFRERPDLSIYLEFLVIPDLEDRIAIAVPWENVHLLSWLNLYLKTHKSGTTVDGILNRYPRR